MNAEKQINEWSCALACFVWTLKKHGLDRADQQEIIEGCRGDFPEWKTDGREGLLTRGGLIDLVMNFLPARKILHTNSAQDCQEYLGKHFSAANEPNFLCGFVFHRSPTNHCMSMVQWTAEAIELMNPTHGKNDTFTWKKLEEENDSDFIVFFK